MTKSRPSLVVRGGSRHTPAHADFVVVVAAIALPAVAGFFVQRIRPVVGGAVCLWILIGWVDLERTNASLHFEGLAVLVVLTGLAGFAALGAFIGAMARRQLRR